MLSLVGVGRIRLSDGTGTEQKRPIFTVVLAVLSLLLTAAAPAGPSAAALPAPPCTWATEYNRTLDELGENRAQWRATDPPGGFWGTGGDDGAVVSPLIPCRYVADVVRHEHMHLQQVRQFGSLGFAQFVLGADRLEIVADCASMLAGSRYTPYVELAGGCTPRDLTDARQLLRDHGTSLGASAGTSNAEALTVGAGR